MGGMGRDPFAGSSRRSTSQRTAAAPDSEAEMKVSIEDALAEREMIVSINDRKVNLKIPKGIRSGQKIKMKGQGQDGGNLLIRIELTDTPSLTLEEDDLVKTVDIYPWQAYLGTQVQVVMPDNTFKVTIPEKMKGGSRIRMREQGYYKKDKTRGDLYIKINIVNPSSLSDKDKEIYKDLSNRYRL
jgi:curved DNA-binding protein